MTSLKKDFQNLEERLHIKSHPPEQTPPEQKPPDIPNVTTVEQTVVAQTPPIPQPPAVDATQPSLHTDAQKSTDVTGEAAPVVKEEEIISPISSEYALDQSESEAARKIVFIVSKGVHRAIVHDNSQGSGEYLYKATCSYCPWQGIFRDETSATNAAKRHVESRYALETVSR